MGFLSTVAGNIYKSGHKFSTQRAKVMRQAEKAGEKRVKFSVAAAKQADKVISASEKAGAMSLRSLPRIKY